MEKKQRPKFARFQKKKKKKKTPLIDQIPNNPILKKIYDKFQ
jgi:hypothetical protein